MLDFVKKIVYATKPKSIPIFHAVATQSVHSIYGCGFISEKDAMFDIVAICNRPTWSDWQIGSVDALVCRYGCPAFGPDNFSRGCYGQ